MKTVKLQQVGLMALATLLVTACEGHVVVDPLSSSYGDLQINDQNIPVAETDLYSQTYQNFYGSVSFQQMNSGITRISKTCTAGDAYCNARGINHSSDVMLYTNNSQSVFQRNIAGNTWYTTVETESDFIILNSIVNGPNGAQLQQVEEDYQVNDDPCGYGGGRGLEVQTHVTDTSGDQEWTTDSCQAYF